MTTHRTQRSVVLALAQMCQHRVSSVLGHSRCKLDSAENDHTGCVCRIMIVMAEQADLKALRPGDPDFKKMTDRQLSNVLHGRDKNDNGEFTASSMGAANDAMNLADECEKLSSGSVTDMLVFPAHAALKKAAQALRVAVPDSMEKIGTALDVIMAASADEQHAAAVSIASNIGMVLVNEPAHPACPHRVPLDLEQEARNLEAIIRYMDKTPIRNFDPSHVVVLVGLVRDRLRPKK